MVRKIFPRQLYRGTIGRTDPVGGDALESVVIFSRKGDSPVGTKTRERRRFGRVARLRVKRTKNKPREARGRRFSELGRTWDTPGFLSGQKLLELGSNLNPRLAYVRAVLPFLDWCEARDGYLDIPSAPALGVELDEGLNLAKAEISAK